MKTNLQDWFFLFLAGAFEVVWAYFLKASKSFTIPSSTLLFFVTLGLSMWLLALSLRSVPLSIAYPVWTGIGAIGTVFVAAAFFKEPLSLLKILFLIMILAGIIGLKFISREV